MRRSWCSGLRWRQAQRGEPAGDDEPPPPQTGSIDHIGDCPILTEVQRWLHCLLALLPLPQVQWTVSVSALCLRLCTGSSYYSSIGSTVPGKSIRKDFEIVFVPGPATTPQFLLLCVGAGGVSVSSLRSAVPSFFSFFSSSSLKKSRGNMPRMHPMPTPMALPCTQERRHTRDNLQRFLLHNEQC